MGDLNGVLGSRFGQAQIWLLLPLGKQTSRCKIPIPFFLCLSHSLCHSTFQINKSFYKKEKRYRQDFLKDYSKFAINALSGDLAIVCFSFTLQCCHALHNNSMVEVFTLLMKESEILQFGYY